MYKKEVGLILFHLLTALRLQPFMPALGEIRRVVLRPVARSLQSYDVRRTSWKRTRYSNDRIKTVLGWRPHVSTADGLREYFAFCRGRMGAMLKIAVIGCGKIADEHVEQIRRIPGCEVVGACDTGR